MIPGDLLVVDGSRAGTYDCVDLVLDEMGVYTVAREGDILLYTGMRREVPDSLPRSLRTFCCFILRGKPCHLEEIELNRVRRSLRLVSRPETD